MKRLSRSDTRCEFEIETPSNIPNALRRALLSDIQTIAPDTVTFRKNTSCQTDEFIAHRIGLIPFKAINLDADMSSNKTTLTVKDRTAMARDIVSDAYVPCTDMPVMKMAPGQELDLDITFKTGTGSDHARFSQVGAVSYKIDDRGVTHMGFDVITDDNPLVHLHAALETLLARIENTIYFVESQYDSHRVILESK